MADAIVTDLLTKSYHGHVVVDNLRLRIPEGPVYGLLGRNGWSAALSAAPSCRAIGCRARAVPPTSRNRHSREPKCLREEIRSFTFRVGRSSQ